MLQSEYISCKITKSWSHEQSIPCDKVPSVGADDRCHSLPATASSEVCWLSQQSDPGHVTTDRCQSPPLCHPYSVGLFPVGNDRTNVTVCHWCRYLGTQ